MKCKQVEILIPEYIDNNIDSTKVKLVEQHIKECNQCNYLYKSLKSSLDLLQAKKDIEEQPFYYTRLVQKIENKQLKNDSLFLNLLKSRVIQPIVYLTSVIIAVYVGILIGSNSNSANNYSTLVDEDKTYTEIFAETQYINEFDIEVLESEYIEDSTIKE